MEIYAVEELERLVMYVRVIWPTFQRIWKDGNSRFSTQISAMKGLIIDSAKSCSTSKTSKVLPACGRWGPEHLPNPFSLSKSLEAKAAIDRFGTEMAYLSE